MDRPPVIALSQLLRRFLETSALKKADRLAADSPVLHSPKFNLQSLPALQQNTWGTSPTSFHLLTSPSLHSGFVPACNTARHSPRNPQSGQETERLTHLHLPLSLSKPQPMTLVPSTLAGHLLRLLLTGICTGLHKSYPPILPPPAPLLIILYPKSQARKAGM